MLIESIRKRSIHFRFRTMEENDRISSIPASILCYILSFLPTKQVVATSVLSKSWNLLWRSVPSFDFDYKTFDSKRAGKECHHFLHSAHSFLLSRHLDQSLHKLCLRCVSWYFDHISVGTLFKAAISGSCRLQHLDLHLHYKCVMPSVVFSWKTLIVLKLASLKVEAISLVDLPLLKILHLNSVEFLNDIDSSQFFSGTPNLEELEVTLMFGKFNRLMVGKFNGLSKLVRANVDVGWEMVKNVEVLFIKRIYEPDLTFDFQNLVQLKLESFFYMRFVKVLEMLNHCPRLQILVISLCKVSSPPDEDEPIWPAVPACISLQTCRLLKCRGSKDEFRFASYIMKNAKYLHTMNICGINLKGKNK